MSHVCYVSQALTCTKTRYTPLVKHIFCLVVLTWKLQPHFQVHPITVLTNVPMRQILHKQDLMGCMTKWVPKLSDRFPV